MRRTTTVLVLLALTWSTFAIQTAHAASATPPDPSWQTDDIVRAVAFGHGAVYLGGSFTHVRPPGAAPGVGDAVRERSPFGRTGSTWEATSRRSVGSRGPTSRRSMPRRARS